MGLARAGRFASANMQKANMVFVLAIYAADEGDAFPEQCIVSHKRSLESGLKTVT